MNKKIIIVFVLVVVAAVVFVHFRTIKKNEKDQIVGQQAFVKLTEISKKIPQAGLTQMGLAIKQYQQKKGIYPAKLAELYPDYIPSKEFIDEIQWQYEAKGNDFLLTKILTKDQELVVVSVDKELIPKVSGEMLVAAAGKTPSTVSAEKSLAEIPVPKPLLPPKPLSFGPGSEGSVEETLIEQPEIVSVEEGQIKPGLSGGMGRNILVWKEADGTLGFGNVIYPEDNRLSVYRNNRWITVSRPPPRFPDDQAEPSEVAESTGKRDSTPGTYYVWRHENGTKGFGNLLPPEGGQIQVLQNNEWIDVKEPQDEGPPVAKTEARTADAQPLDQLAAEYSNRYFVWKDKRGNLGYGNIQYPGTEEVAYICVDGNWQKLVN